MPSTNTGWVATTTLPVGVRMIVAVGDQRERADEHEHQRLVPVGPAREVTAATNRGGGDDQESAERARGGKGASRT